jgi:hypothetical protein
MEINKENLEKIHLTALDLADICAKEFEEMKNGIKQYPDEIREFVTDHVQKFIADIFREIIDESVPTKS